MARKKKQTAEIIQFPQGVVKTVIDRTHSPYGKIIPFCRFLEASRDYDVPPKILLYADRGLEKRGWLEQALKDNYLYLPKDLDRVKQKFRM